MTARDGDQSRDPARDPQPSALSAATASQREPARDLPHRRNREQTAIAALPAATPGPIAWLARFIELGLALGLAAGLIEVLLLEGRRHLASEASLGVLKLNRHYLWMVPAADAVAGLLIAAILGGLVLACSPLAGLKTRLRWLAPRLLVTSALSIPLLTAHRLHPAASLVLAAGAAIRACAWFQPRAKTRFLHAAAAASLGALAALWAYDRASVTRAEDHHWASLPAAHSDAPHVVLIVLDTVRADRTSLHGYERDTTPNLARLAQRGVVFDQARSPDSWTLPSHASMFTGLWPHTLMVSRERPLDERFLTLAEVLRDQGYATAGFVANMFFCNSWFGLDQGFLRYEDFPERDQVTPAELIRNTELGQRLEKNGLMRLSTAGGGKTAAQVNRDALTWLDQNATRRGDRPFFLFLNYIDAHAPYLPPDDTPSTPVGRSPANQGERRLMLDWNEACRGPLDESQRALASDCYDRCLAYLDTQLGQLVAAFEVRGLMDRTLFVVTSDHGEHFGEHDLYLHGNSLYRPLIHVPLVIVPPAGHPIARARVDQPVSLRDLAATILTELNDPNLTTALPGNPLQPLWRPGPLSSSTAPPGPVLAEAGLNFQGFPPPLDHRVLMPVRLGPMHAIIDDGWTYIRLATGQEQLFSIAEDPHERSNRAGDPDQAERVAHLRNQLGALVPGVESQRTR